MDGNISVNFEEWQAQAQQLVEQDGTRFLCLYLDQKTHEVNMLSDSETIEKLGDGKVLKELEEILKSSKEDKGNLHFYNHNRRSKDAQPCTNLSHSCHQPPPMLQLSWEKNPSSSCFVDQSFPVKSYDKLPAEILRNIFRFLKPSDLTQVLLVSKNWKSVAEEPALWAGLCLPDKCTWDVDTFSVFLDSSFARKLQHLALTDGPFRLQFEIDDIIIEELLLLNLVSIEIGIADWSKVSDDLLVKLVNSCKKCEITEYFGDLGRHSRDDLPKYSLGVKKIEGIIRSMQHKSNLRSFKLGFSTYGYDYRQEEGDRRMRLDLSFVPPEVLATAFSRLQEIDLSNLKLGLEQMNAMAEVGLSNLTKLSLRKIQLDKAKLMLLLKALDKTQKMKSLDLSELDVTEIPSMLLSQVINKVERVVLRDIVMETYQIEDILLAIIRGDSMLKHFGLALDDDDYHNYLSQVNPEVLAKASNMLESVAFNSLLTREQDKMIFEEMSMKTNLKSLERIRVNHRDDNDFPSYYGSDPQVLAKALNNLKSVRINFLCEGCGLTWPQLVAFVKQLESQTNLEVILSDGDKIKVEDLKLK